MSSLSSSPRLGNTSTSALLRSSQSLQSEINSYSDSLAAYKYELSTKTSSDLAEYQDYLTKRIDNLQATGSVTDASKALTLTKTITSAVHSNVSSDIQRENIQIMSGNANLQDKYSTIVGQFSRAMGIGDLALAQSLESQAYSVSQQIQYQAQQAAEAGKALAKASQASAIYGQQGIQKSLDEAQKTLTHGVSQVGIKAADKAVGDWVNTNRDVLAAMGVVIPAGAQPNYWNLVEGIQAAKYNSLVLQAQYESPTNPNVAKSLMYQAKNLMEGATPITDTLYGKSLTIQEIQQAANDPNMFQFNNASGKYEKTAQSGYQYINDPQTGQPYLAPTFSGNTEARNNQLHFLNPNQTAQLSSLGLNFTSHATKTGNVTGDGVEISTTNDTPQWLRDVIGDRTQVYVGKSGDLQFAGSSSNGQGMSYFSLMNVGGLYGIFEHGADGSTRLAGGNYGFDSGAAQLLINAGQQKQYQIQLQTQAEQAAQAAALKLAQPQPLPQVTPVSAPAPVRNPATPAAAIQPTITTKALQPANYNPQPATFNPQQTATPTTTVKGIPLAQPKLNAIKL